jgi:osmotically-inducible protein OsmY
VEGFRRRQNLNSETDFLDWRLSSPGDHTKADPNLQTDAGHRRNFGSRFDDFYRTGMQVQGYPYNYEVNLENNSLEERSESRLDPTADQDNRFLLRPDDERRAQVYQRNNPDRELWRITGPYTGRGPRDYHRTDEQILEDICERLTQHGQVDASGIDVKVNDGEVYLSGTVDRKREKRIAEDLAYTVRGVRDVINRIRLDAEDGVRVRGAGFENVVMPGRMHAGMNVYGRDGGFLGRVKLVREQDFLLDRPMARDYYVPFSAVRRTNGDIMLWITRDEIHTQHWEKPPLFGSFEKAGGS